MSSGVLNSALDVCNVQSCGVSTLHIQTFLIHSLNLDVYACVSDT